MRLFYLSTLLCCLIWVACGNTPAPEAPQPTPTTVPEPAPAPSASTDEQPASIDLNNYKEERDKINAAVDQTNRDLATLTLVEFERDYNGQTYQILQYRDANGVLVKAKGVSEKDSWEIYASPAAKGDQQRIYASYLAETENRYEPIRKQYYHIGSMQDRDRAFTLVLDESNAPMVDAPRQDWLDRYQAAAPVLTNAQ